MGTRISSQDDSMYMTAEEFWYLLENSTLTGFKYLPELVEKSSDEYVGRYKGKSVYIVAETFSLTDLQEVL